MKARAPLAALLLGIAGCGSVSLKESAPSLGSDPAAACAALTLPVQAADIGLPTGGAYIDSAAWIAAAPLSINDRAPFAAARIAPATPAHCRVLGRIAPIDPAAPPIRFQVNLPGSWNGRSVQYGGGGFNGVLITGLALVPAARFDRPAPLAQGYVTVGTDSGHETRPGEPPQAFALNDEALENFAHASYKKVRDVSVALMRRAYGRPPARLYFVGSSEGGREGLTMAQRYPADFDGILSRVPVINWTGLQHAGTRNGLATLDGGWMGPAQVNHVARAVLAACDARDGLADGIVADPVGCKERFDTGRMACLTAFGKDEQGCLSAAQVRAFNTLLSPYRFPFALAHGVTEYPGWGLSGEGTAASGPAGGWQAWWMGSRPPAIPPEPGNGIAWIYGSGAIRYFYARDPGFDVRRYRPEDFADRVRAVSALMDSTNPDLSAFQARGGKLVLLENLGDFAQSPYAGIRYHESVVQRMGAASVARFMRLYAAPSVDHVGTGAPANADLFPALVDWVERNQAPERLELVEQQATPPFAVQRARPLCEWPLWPRYRGGSERSASSFECGR